MQGDVSSSQGVVAAQSGQNDGASWQSVLEGVTSVAAWAGVEAGDESAGRGESSSPVKAAAAWMTPESSTGNAVDAAGRYLNQNSAFGGSTVPSPASVLPPQNQWQGKCSAEVSGGFADSTASSTMSQIDHEPDRPDGRVRRGVTSGNALKIG